MKYSRSRFARFTAAVVEGYESRTMFTALVSVDMGSSNGKQLSQAATAVSGVTSTDFVRGGSNYVPVSTGSNQVGAMYGYPRQSDNKYGQSETQAVAKQHYYTFTVTPAAGKSITITGLDFAPFVENTTKGANLAVEYQVGSGTVITPWTGTTHASTGSGSLVTTTFAAGTNPALQNSTSPITFRIVYWYYDPASPTTYLLYSTTSIGWHSGADVVLQGAVADAAPANPTNLIAAPVVNGVANKLTWNDNSTNETEYRVTRSSAPMYDDMELWTLPAGSITYTDSTALVNVKYRYTVMATNASGYSGTVSAETRTIHIIEAWNQYPSVAGNPSLARPATYNFAPATVVMGGGGYADNYGAFQQLPGAPEGTPDTAHLSQANIASAVNHLNAIAPGGDGILINDIENYDFNPHDLCVRDVNGNLDLHNPDYALIDSVTNAGIALYTEFANDARAVDPTVKVGLYCSTSPHQPGFTTELNAAADYIQTKIVNQLFLSGVYDYATPNIYLHTANLTGFMDAASAAIVDLKTRGVPTIPMFDDFDESRLRPLTASDEDYLAQNIIQLGGTAMRWRGDKEAWTSDNAALQDEVVNYIKSH